MAQWAIARRAAHAVHTLLESVGDRPALQLARAYGTDSLIVPELWVRLGGSTPEQVLADLRQISSPEKKTWQPQFLETSEIRSRKRFPRMTIRCGEMAVPKWQNIHRNDVGPPMFPLHGKKHKNTKSSAPTLHNSVRSQSIYVLLFFVAKKRTLRPAQLSCKHVRSISTAFR